MDKFDVGDDTICTGDTQQYWSCINMIAMAFNLSPHLDKKIPPSPQPHDHHDHHDHEDEDAGDVKMIAVVIQFLPVIAPASSLGLDNHSPSSEVADLGDDEDDDGGGDDGDNDGGGDDSDCGGVDIGGDGEIL